MQEPKRRSETGEKCARAVDTRQVQPHSLPQECVSNKQGVAHQQTSHATHPWLFLQFCVGGLQMAPAITNPVRKEAAIWGVLAPLLAVIFGIDNFPRSTCHGITTVRAFVDMVVLEAGHAVQNEARKERHQQYVTCEHHILFLQATKGHQEEAAHTKNNKPKPKLLRAEVGGKIRSISIYVVPSV